MARSTFDIYSDKIWMRQDQIDALKEQWRRCKSEISGLALVVRNEHDRTVVRHFAAAPAVVASESSDRYSDGTRAAAVILNFSRFAV
jgi:hypothetical protein